jgi:hypothetical protein
MTDEKKECPIGGCDRKHHRSHLMCNPHWRMVPKELQGLIYKAARKMWRGQGSEEWREARDRAVHAVEEKEAANETKSGPIGGTEPVSTLTALGESFAEVLEKEGCRGFLLIAKGEEGSVTQTGCDDQEEALSDLLEHVTALCRVVGVGVQYIFPENN